MAARFPVWFCFAEAVSSLGLEYAFRSRRVNVRLGSCRDRNVEVLVDVVLVDAPDGEAVVEVLYYLSVMSDCPHVSLSLGFTDEPPWGESTEQKMCAIMETHSFKAFSLQFIRLVHADGNLLQRDDDDGLKKSRSSLARLLGALTKNVSLLHLELRVMLATAESTHQNSELSLFASTLATSALRLKSLTIAHKSTQAVLAIIKALETNFTIASLTIEDYYDKQELFAALIDLLSVNFTLKDLNLHDTALAHDDARMATITSMLQDEDASKALALLHKFEKMQPTSARVFFCGNGWAGKTTLRKTMVNPMDHNLINMVRQFKRSVRKGMEPERTSGIEVTRLNEWGIEFTLWDLAGQKEYHAFHDLMFPHKQGPSLFLITCSLIPEQEEKCSDPKTLENVAAELRYWLRYLSSNARKTRPPHVTFVFTHFDKLRSHETAIIIMGRIGALVKELEQEFDARVQVVGSPFFVDGRKPKAVHMLLEHTIKVVEEITSTCQPVFSLCNAATKWISNWMKDHPQEPWMKKDDLINLFSMEFFGSKSSVRQRREAVPITNAILFDLHLMGTLIHFLDKGIILVNIPWFCKDFMGRILEQTTRVSMRSTSADEKLGVWKREYFKTLLESLCNTKRMRQRRGKNAAAFQLDGDQLIDIMIELEFCFMPDSSSIFIPATLCGSNWQTLRRWAAEVKKASCQFGYVGRRLECEDMERTFLTPGFFQRLQVHLRNMLKPSQYVLEKDLIKIVDDCMEILVEFNEAPTSFIDIMVRYSKSKHLDHVLDFVSQKVIQSIRNLQSKSGCWKGVYLVEVVLRPSCVEGLVMREMKQKQRVSLEELRAKVIHSDLINDFENITYAWSSLECAGLGEEYTPIIELIGERRLSDMLIERLMKVEDLRKQLGLSQGNSSSSSSTGIVYACEEQPELFLVEHDGYEHMGVAESQMNRMEAKIDAIAQDMGGVKGAIVRLLNGIVPEIQRLLTEISNVNLALVDEGGSAHLPQFFLFKEHQTLVSKVVRGQRNLRLGFMCERHPMPHLPLAQEGIEIRIMEEGVVRSIQPYLHFLLSALALGFKLSAPIARANGILVSDWGGLIDGLRLKSQAMHERSLLFPIDGCTAFGGGKQMGIDPVVFQQARIWVLNCLREKKCTNEAQILLKFGLMKKQLRNGRCAWLCEDHYHHAV